MIERVSECCGAKIHDEISYRTILGTMEIFLNMDVCSKCHKPAKIMKTKDDR